MRQNGGSKINRAPTQVLLAAAADIVQQSTERSKVFNEAVEEKIPRFEKEEVVIGKVVGRGGFAVVNEVKGFRIISQNGVKKTVNRRVLKTSSKLSDNSSHRANPLDETTSSLDTRETTGSNEIRKQAVANDGEKNARYVVKQVCDDMSKTDKLTFMKGVVDMTIEAKFLANLSHPHIMELRGVSAGGPYREGYFLILERLDSTLADRIKTWMHQDHNSKGISGVFLASKKKASNMIYDQYRSAYSVADAINYLHKKKIIYRDLKPSNMGFTSSDVLKLFDFGLAKELRSDEYEGKGLYNMTGMTGALRYMAPEVGKKDLYNLKADVYSWSMLVWYMLALEPPFGSYSQQMIMDRVFNLGVRPPIFDSWPAELSSLLKKCWDEKIAARPDFSEIVQVVKTLLDKLETA